MSTRWWSNVFGCAGAAIGLGLAVPVFGAVILVTNDYPTIQAAINAAGSNDTIQVQAGTYREFLNIVAPVHIVGSSSTNCVVHHTNDVLVTITSAGTVELAGMEICGGEVAFGGGFSPTVPRGIVSSNTTLVLNDVALNNTRNFSVTVMDGSLYATNVALYTRHILTQWDVGFQLKGCFARIYQLTQLDGQIDHTININDPPANFSDVRVENSTIRASHLGYGECVRTYTASSVVITNCDLYRAAGGDAVTIGNQAIGVNGYSNTVVITDNLIDSLPTGIRIFGSLPNSNAIKIERNVFIDCGSNGVLVSSMTYTGVDLGGGQLQSVGQNYFYNPGARDVELSSMTAGIPAKSNCWSTANPDDSIFDQLDTNILGRVSYSPTFCEITNVACSLFPAVVTNVVGLFDNVGVTVTTNGAPAANVTVTFNVSGAHTIGPTTLFTDTNGQAGITYLGANFGTDTILASGSIGLNAFSCQATKQWIGLPPLLTCPADITTNTAAGTCARTVTYNAGAVGTPTPVVTYDVPSGTSFSPGVIPVTVTASNAFGVTNCSFTVTVSDSELPSITCTGDITTNLPFGQSQVNIIFGAPIASDNCGSVTTNCSPVSGSAFALGTNTVTCTAIDSSANTNSCSFHVIVLGLPTTNVVCSLFPAVVTNVVGLFDNVGVTVTTNGAPAANVAMTFNVSGAHTIGPTTLFTGTNGQAGITYLGTNFGTDIIFASGSIGTNAFSCQATKQWVGLPPLMTCPANIITNTAAGTCASTVAYNASAVGIPTPVVTYDLPSGTSFSPGVTPVTVTASNAFGTTNCSFSVTINDSELPAITCTGDITTNIPFGQSQVNISFSAPTASDNCGTVTTSSAPASGSAFALGTNTVVSTAADTSGNTNTCSFNVIVRQTSPDDLAILSVAPPKKISLSSKKPSQTKSVKVAIQNIGPQTVTIDTIGKLTNLVALAIESLGACPAPVVQIVPPKKGFPVVLAPKKKLTVIYNVTFDCANDDAQGTGHEDFRYTVTVDHAALDGKADANTANDNCPRDPSSSDKGCGGKNAVTKHLGADVLTDVIAK